MAADPLKHPALNEGGWTAAALAATTGGTWRDAPADPAARIAGVSIDTRTLRPGELFIALRGERFDGHDFVRDALAQGAMAAVVERGAAQTADMAGPLLEVDDTLAALHALARRWRDLLGEHGCTVIAVAGSNGKTTTRHLIHHLLHEAPLNEAAHKPEGESASPGGMPTAPMPTTPEETRARSRPLRGTQSPKSFNNDIGVPLTLLGASPADDFVVVEIGTNQAGEVARLAALARPAMAVVVSIGREHLEAFGRIEAVAREELSLLRFVEPGGWALIPAADWLSEWLPALPADVRVQRIEPEPLAERALTLPGRHALHNASAAVGVARAMGVGEAHIAGRLADVEPMPGRFAVREVGALTLIDDTYNANPESVRAALATVSEQWAEAPRRVFVFADMKELGETAAAAHREIGRVVAHASPGFDLLVTLGPLAMFAAAELRRLQPMAEVHAAAEWDDALPSRVAGLLTAGDVVLLKGSRSMRLERLIPAIESAFAESPTPC